MTISEPQRRSRAEAYQVFLSSTFVDLGAERKAVRDALAELNNPLSTLGVCLIPIDLQAGAETEPSLDVCLQRLEGCDLVVTLVGHRAGWLTPDGRSITEREFDYAQSNGIPRLAYLRDSTTPVLPEFVDKDDAHVAALNRFKRAIDDSLKRDTFRTPEQLRGHILRDVLNWVLNQPSVKTRLAGFGTSSALPEIKKYLDAIQSGNTGAAVAVVTSHRFALDVRRFGTEGIHRELLCDLLELGNLSAPTRVTDPYLRSKLLLNLLSDFPGSLLAPAALQEAKSLEALFADPVYSFSVSRAEARLHARCDRALPALKQMLVCAWRTADSHRKAMAHSAIATYYGDRGDHKRALRWYWTSITMLCEMREICPHCLGNAFLGAAGESLNCHDCGTTNNRLLKAYLIGQLIPDRKMQFTALFKLSSHLAAHEAIFEAVACAVLAARLAKATWPEDEETGLSAMLSEIVAGHGRETVAESLKRIEDRKPESVLDELVQLHELESFTNSLDLRPSTFGDHW